MNDSLITEAMDRLAANPEAYAFKRLSFWHRGYHHKYDRNRWSWLYPEDVIDAMDEPVTCICMDHWAEEKPTQLIGWPYPSLWNIDATCRELGFKPVFLAIRKGNGAGLSDLSYGEYNIIFPTENDVVLYDAYNSRAMLV